MRPPRYYSSTPSATLKPLPNEYLLIGMAVLFPILLPGMP